MHKNFSAAMPGYVQSPWLRYQTSASKKLMWCQADALIVDIPRGVITVIEAKYQHTVDAYWQLHHYLNVLRAVFGTDSWHYALCEVVKWYDPAVRCPQSPRLLREIKNAKPGGFYVHIWKP